jgi:hypothetical protein
MPKPLKTKKIGDTARVERGEDLLRGREGVGEGVADFYFENIGAEVAALELVFVAGNGDDGDGAGFEFGEGGGGDVLDGEGLLRNGNGVLRCEREPWGGRGRGVP